MQAGALFQQHPCVPVALTSPSPCLPPSPCSKSELLAVVRQPEGLEGPTRVDITTDNANDLVLHWGVSKQGAHCSECSHGHQDFWHQHVILSVLFSRRHHHLALPSNTAVCPPYLPLVSPLPCLRRLQGVAACGARAAPARHCCTGRRHSV